MATPMISREQMAAFSAQVLRVLERGNKIRDTSKAKAEAQDCCPAADNVSPRSGISEKHTVLYSRLQPLLGSSLAGSKWDSRRPGTFVAAHAEGML